MAADPSHLVFKARFVFPVNGPPIAGGTLVVRGSHIVAVEKSGSSGPVHDLGNVAILPGLVNAHTHLELGDMPAPLGTPGMPLPDWIRLVVAHRRAAAVAGPIAIARGLRESLASGTTTLGDIVQSDWRQPRYFDELPELKRPRDAVSSGELPSTILFYESIAPTRDRVEGAIVAAEAFLSAPSLHQELRPGLSPHAPYTVHPRLLAALVELSRRYQVPLAMHLAESREELELLHAGSGPFREMLREVNAWDPQPDARHGWILDYLEQLARAPRALVIHGNYLNPVETRFLAAHAATMTVVYCPRTHAFFRHPPYPLAPMLAAGVALALGTDSRASNPDLSLWEEMKFVAQWHPELPGSTVLELGTIRGAAALGLAERLGTLEAGKQADFVVVAFGEDLEGAKVHDSHDLLWAPSARVVQTWVRGQRAWPASAGSSESAAENATTGNS